MIRRSLKYTFSLTFILSILSIASVASAKDATPPVASAAPPAAAASAAPAAAPQQNKADADDPTQQDLPAPTLEQIEEAAKPPKLQSNVFSTGKIVRRRLLYRSTRFELAPFFGVTLNDAFNRALMPGVSLAYHLTNDLGIMASFGYGVAQWNTDLGNNFRKTLGVPPATDTKSTLCPAANYGNPDCITFSKLQFFADLGISYVPIYGKFILFGVATIHWDFHLVAGFAIMKQQAYTLEKNGKSFKEVLLKDSKSTLEGIKPGGSLTAGIRLYLNDFMSLNFDLRNLIYSTSDYTVGNKSNSSFTDKLFFSAGLSFFLPTEVKVSW